MTRLLLPVADSPTIRSSVEYAVERLGQAEGPHVIRLLAIPPLQTPRRLEQAYHLHGEPLLERTVQWIETADSDVPIDVETQIIDAETPLRSPVDVARLLVDELAGQEVDRVVIDPGYGPRSDLAFTDVIVEIITAEADVDVEVAPEADVGTVEGVRAAWTRYALVFLISLVFYVVLSGGLSMYTVVTGAVTAGVVTVTLGAFTLWHPPGLRYAPGRLARAALYVPYLLVAIARANVNVTRVILHPDLPIDTRVVRYHPAVYGAMPLTTLANSITLTPGTLSMRIDRGELLVHTLTPAAREGLIAGSLERAVRFVFYGRRSVRVPTPDERGDVTVIDRPSTEG